MSDSAALLLIDLQRAIDDASWGKRNHPGAEQRALRALTLWRHLGWPLFHIRHDSKEPNSTYRPGQPLHEFKPETAPAEGETVLGKTTCSAFASTDLAERLRSAGIERVFVCGVITNNSVESTVRAGGDLGFRMYLLEDACFTFGKGRWSAQDIHDMSLQNLDGEYCTVTGTALLTSGFLEGLYGSPEAARYRETAERAAAVAREFKMGKDLILAALLMDIGHLLHHPDAQMHPALGAINHAQLGAEFLRKLGFDEDVCKLVEFHNETVRYLAAYEMTRKQLFPEDLQLVEVMGGRMSESEAEIFNDKHISGILGLLRHCEERARIPAAAPVPEFASYREMIQDHLNALPSQQR